MTDPNIVDRSTWLRHRLDLLEAEKELTQAKEVVTRKRMAMPWVAIDKTYNFTGPRGTLTLDDLFRENSQLIIYHFMFAPDWESGCKSCSFWADNFEGLPIHLAHRDTTLAFVSRAPFEKLATYKARMGWTFEWVSSFDSDFNYDFRVSFTPEEVAAGQAYYNFGMHPNAISDEQGVSVFVKKDGQIFHSYSTYARGIENLNSAYHLLDLTPKGRDEDEFTHGMQWVRRHDEY